MFHNFRSARKASARLIIWSLLLFLVLSAGIGVIQALLGGR